jgi:hypothetical protein
MKTLPKKDPSHRANDRTPVVVQDDAAITATARPIPAISSWHMDGLGIRHRHRIGGTAAVPPSSW